MELMDLWQVKIINHLLILVDFLQISFLMKKQEKYWMNNLGLHSHQIINGLGKIHHQFMGNIITG